MTTNFKISEQERKTLREAEAIARRYRRAYDRTDYEDIAIRDGVMCASYDIIKGVEALENLHIKSIRKTW